MKKSNLTKTLLAITLIAVMCCSLVSFVGCNAGCYINAPETLQAELGVYVIPDYDVVDANGIIKAGFDVRLKSVTDANGQKVDFDQNSVTITEKGVYKFVYGAKGVKDATVNIDFADRTAPTVNFSSSSLPAFYIKGNSYRIPAYTLSGDYVREKCWVKVFYVSADKATEKEAEIKSNRFDVTESSGSYEIRIHVEDATGNANEYVYSKPIDGPETIKENTIVYFDEPFGERQVYCLESNYTGEYVSKQEMGDKAREGDNGAYKVTFKGVETNNNEGYVALKTPAILDVNGYTELEMYVYNDSDADAIFGAKWWGDTPLKKGAWTRVTFSVDNWGNCVQAEAGNRLVGTNDISNMCLRILFDYNKTVIPNGTFYFSPLRGIPRIPSEVTASDDVTLDRNSYSVGSVVNLTAAEKTNKVVDCFVVDGKPIAGDSFVVTETQHSVSVKYVDELTFDTMTWGTGFHYIPANAAWLERNFVDATFVAESNMWVLSTDVVGGYNEETGGQTMNVTWMVGNNECVELQLSKTEGTLKWYFDGKDWNTPVANLSGAQFNKLKNASAQDPVNVTVMRNGDLILILIDGEFVGRCEINNGLSSNAFGIGYRKEGADKPDTVLLANTKAVMGEERTELYYATLNATIGKENDDVSTDKESYRLGDVVTLTAKEAGNGQVFGYFTLDGNKIIGNSFVVTKRSHTVGAVYVTLSAITFNNGVTAAEGNSVGLGTNLTLSHGEAPEQGKVFDYYLVDGQIKVYGNVFTTTDTEHTISAVWVDAADFTWGGADERYTCDKIMGSDASVWQDRGFVGHVFGSSEYWAVKVDVKHTDEWNSFEFVQGTKQSIRIRFHQGNYFGIIVITDNGSEWTPDGHSEFVHAWPNQNAAMVAKLLAGTTITCVRYGDTITMYADNIPFFTTDYAVDHTGNWFGVGHVNANDATAPEMTNVQFIMGKDKVDAHLESLKATFTKTNVTTDRDEYRIGDTVTLTAAPAPEGQKFSHFEVDDVRINGNTFVVTKSAHKLVAVYNAISTIELGAGVSTADGETEYARGATVTLAYDKASLNGKLFNYFTVDGNRIVGNTFVTTAAKHVIAIVTADTVDDLTWVDSTEAEEKNASFNWSAYKFQGVSVGRSDYWVMEVSASKFDTLGSDWYSLDILIGSNATLQIRLLSAGNAMIQAMGSNLGDGQTLCALDASVIDACKSASEANPVKFTCIRNGDTFYVLFNGSLVLKTDFDFKASDNSFGVGGTDCGEWLTNHPTYTYRYRTGEEIAASKTISKVTGTNVTLDKADGSYTLGDTVTLGHGEAELGYAFSYYKVNGEKINGNTFAAVKAEYTVEAVFENIADTYYIDVEEPTNTIFIRDGQLSLPTATIKDGNGDTVSGYTITTSVIDLSNRSYEITDGVANITYKGAITLTIKYSCEGLEGKDKSFTVLVQDEDGTVLTADEVGASVVKASEFSSIEYSTDQVCSAAGDSGAIKITVTALDGNEVYGYLPFDFADGKYVDFYVYDTTPNSSKTKVIGCHWYGDTALAHGAWTKVRLNLLNNKGEVSNVEDGKGWRIRFVNVAVGDVFYISSMKLGTESTQLTDISQWKEVASITAAEYVTDVKYDGNDVAVTETGSLKVTVGGSDNGLASTQNNVTDLSGYSAVYFYVYTEAASAQSGAYWCGDTALVAGQWTKVYLTSASGNGGPWNTDNSKIFEAGLKDMVVRIMGCSAGDVFYVTSLYGIPKA